MPPSSHTPIPSTVNQPTNPTACRRTTRWEAHIWEERRQMYLGGFENEDHAAKVSMLAGKSFETHSIQGLLAVR